jgi:ABC-type glycerol-3-phosphate transport system substrate-binding protein
LFRERSIIKLGIIALLAVSSGCATGAGSGGSDPSKQSKEAANQVNNQPAEIVFFSTSGASQASFDQDLGESIRKKFPNYTIKYIPTGNGVSLSSVVTSGEPIDIIFDSIGNFPDSVIDSGMKYDMSELIKKHNIDLSRFEPTLVDAMKKFANGGMYGLPVSNINMVLFYNKDILDKFGVPYPKDGMTWDEAVDLGKKLTRTDGQVQYLGLGLSQGHYMRMNQFSLPYMDPATQKATINSDSWKQIFQTIYMNPAEPSEYRAYIEGNSGKVPFTDEFVKTKVLAMDGLLSNSPTTEWNNINWDMVSLPAFKSLPDIGSQSYPTYYSVTSISKHQDQAMEVIKYLTSDEFQMTLSKKGIMPVMKDEAFKNALGQEGKFKDKHYKAVYYNKFAPIAPKSVYDLDIEKFYRKDISDLVLGKTDLNTVLRTAEEAANKKITERKNK